MSSVRPFFRRHQVFCWCFFLFVCCFFFLVARGIVTVGPGQWRCLAGSGIGRGRGWRAGMAAYLWFRNLQIPNLDTASGEVRDLELDLDGPLSALARGADAAHAAAEASGHAAAVLVVAPDAREAQLGAHEELLEAAELLDLPDDGALLGSIVHAAYVGPEARRVGVVRHGHDDFDVVGGAAALELGPGLQHVLYPAAAVGLDDALDPDQRLDLGVEAVRHQLELPVGRYEGYGAVALEAGQADALVEPHVLHLDGLAARGPPRGLEHDLVVEAEAQLGHARQVAFHLYGAEDLGPQHVAVRRHEEVERFYDVQEHLVLPVPDPLGPPRDGVGDGDGRPLDLQLVGLLGDVFLEDLGLGRLRVAKVHHLV